MLKELEHKLLNFLETGKTIYEISEEFLVKPEVVEGWIKELEDLCDIFPMFNKDGKKIFVAREKIVKPELKPKIWKYTRGKDRLGRPQPYLIVRIPDDFPWDKIKIYLFGDIHFGAKGFDETIFQAMLDLVLSKEYAFIVINGDLIENALGTSIGGGIYDQTIPPREQIIQVREMLRPVAHRILLTIPGNHEWRSFIGSGIESLEFGFCEPLEIPYFNEPVHLDILWKNHIFTFYVQHGKSGALTKGGKINVARRPLASNEHTMFTMMGHVHDPISTKNTKRCRELIRDEKNDIVGMRIVKLLEYIVINSATYIFWGTYGSRSGYSPTAKDLVHTCVIESDGNYFLEKKPLLLKY